MQLLKCRFHGAINGFSIGSHEPFHNFSRTAAADGGLIDLNNGHNAPGGAADGGFIQILNGIEVYEIKLGHEYLMSSLFHEAEVALADIGLASLSGAIERGQDFLYVCFDNESYMNTGGQRSGTTPFAARTRQ